MNDTEERFPEGQEATRSVPAAPAGRRRRTDRYQEETPAESPASYRPPVLSGQSETAREAANRLNGAPLREAGAPPRAGTVSRIRLGDQSGRPESRERVGYAPGRMGMPQRPRLSEEGRARMAEENRIRGAEPSRGRGPEGSGMPGRDTRARGARPAERGPVRPPREEEPPRRGRRWLTILVIVLVVLGLLILGVNLIPENADGLPGTIRKTVGGFAGSLFNSAGSRPHAVTAFLVNGETETTAPADLTFSITTEKGVADVRLVDGEGNILQTSRMVADNTENTLWP